MLKKLTNILFVIFDFLVCDVALTLAILITEKYAFILGSDKWQKRATKLRKIGYNLSNQNEKKRKNKKSRRIYC